MFSSRLKWDAPPNPLSRLLEEKRRAGIRILDLTESNPTHAGLAYPGREILGALADAAALTYEPTPRGLISAREAVSQYYAERGAATDPARVLLTASTSEAYAYLFKLLADPGDEVLAPRPSYPLFEFLAGLENIQVRQYPLRYDGVWHVDFEALESAIGARTRAIVVVNPNNPTGSFLKREEAARLTALAAEHGIAILSDEVFSDYALADDPSRAPSFAAGSAEALTFTMSGLSKIAGLPQMKLAWIVAAGRGADEALDKLEWIADTYLSVATPIQAALPRILAAARTVRDQIRQRAASNLLSLREQIAGSAASCLRVEGGWYAVLQIPRTRPEEQWVASLLRDHDVLVQPGFFYDFETEAHLVVSLLSEPATFREGVQRLSGLL